MGPVGTGPTSPAVNTTVAAAASGPLSKGTSVAPVETGQTTPPVNTAATACHS